MDRGSRGGWPNALPWRESTVMKYIIFLYGGSESGEASEGDESVLWSRSVQPGEEAYMRRSVLPAMRPCSDEDYRTGPAKLLSTAVRYSYVLDGDVVYWCMECDPGLVVVRFAPDASLAMAELRSPNPQFGGRVATDEELDHYDEDNEEESHQYNLIFDAWDAQFEEDRSKRWEVVDDETKGRFDAALAHVRRLDEKMASEHFQKQSSE